MIKPFKLKKEFIPNYRILNLAQEIFGTPVDGISSPAKCESTWQFIDHKQIVTLTISQNYESDRVDLQINQESIYTDTTISINLKNYQPDWKNKFKKFIDGASKPWEEWTEEEILCDPMWIYFFWKANRTIPEQFHNAMVLFSYKDNQNSYIRKYFDEKEANKGSAV